MSRLRLFSSVSAPIISSATLADTISCFMDALPVLERISTSNAWCKRGQGRSGIRARLPVDSVCERHYNNAVLSIIDIVSVYCLAICIRFRRLGFLNDLLSRGAQIYDGTGVLVPGSLS